MTDRPMDERAASLRTLLILGSVLLIGAVITVLLAAAESPKMLLNSADSGQRGALALRLWMDRRGFDVVDSVILPTDLDRADVLFALEPNSPYDVIFTQAVRGWVRDGNILVIAGNPSKLRGLLNSFTVDMDVLPAVSEDIMPGAPTLTLPPVSGRLPRMFSYGLYSTRDDVIPHLFRNDVPVLISFPEGRGHVWVAGMLDPFSNLGLQDEQNARVIANIINTFPARARIAFDDGAYATSADENLSTWLFESMPGRGLLISGVILFVFLAARGRRFGRPQPIPDETLRREPVEYIQAIAHLFRRAGGRDEILRHTQTQFRRHLARRYAIDSRLPDAEFVTRIAERDPSTDEAALRDLLVRLGRSKISEAELLHITHDVDVWLRNLH